MAHMAKKILFSMTICVLALGLIECILGCTGIARKVYRHRQSISPIIMRDPILSWVLKPNLNIPYGDVKVSTGKQGFRGGDPRPGNYSRILCLGDSVTFGWNVSESETFPSQLAACLESRYPGRWDVINGGVPGHSSHQGQLRLESLLRDIQPVKVLVCYGINDRFPAAAADSVCLTRKSPLNRSLLQSGIVIILSAFRPSGTRIRMEPDTNPDRVTNRVPVEQFERNIEWIFEICRCKNADVMLVSEYVNNLDTLKDAYHKVLEKLAKRHGIPLIDCVALLHPQDIQAKHGENKSNHQIIGQSLEHASRNVTGGTGNRINIPLMSFEQYERDRGIMLDPYHPNADGYRLIAESIAVHIN